MRHRSIHIFHLFIILLVIPQSIALDRSNEDNVVLLNDDGEIENDQPVSKVPEDVSDEYIDKMVHSNDGTDKDGASAQSSPFEEFVTEKRGPGNLDPKADALYNSALEILSRKRWSDIGQRDLRGAYMDLEEAAQLKHPDAEKILAFSYLFGDYRWSISEATQIFEKLAAQGSADGHLGLGFLYSTGVGLGYRYGYGVSTTQSCETSLMWYRKVAEKVASKVKLTGSASVQRIRIPDEIESSSTTGTLLDSNVFSYYKYLAETGDMQAILGLAQLYLTGGKADAGNTQAYGYLGKMYLEGTSATPQNNVTAFQYFKKAADKGNAVGQSGLGMMFLYGYGVKTDPHKALKLFTLAAEQGLADAQLHLGQMHFQGLGVKRDFKQALKYFQLASQSGHILAVYNLAQMHSKGTGVMRNCQVHGCLPKVPSGSVDEAAFRYLFLAEFGYEAAQTNFAYLMDQEDSRLFAQEEAYHRALLSWQRAANQDYPVARVKLGDYKYYGLGTAVDLPEAANHYKIAATSHQNAQAMFNLGYMHEHGLGVNKDLHLAKRYYDLAAETSTEAFVPVALALVKLKAEFLLENSLGLFTGLAMKNGSPLELFRNWEFLDTYLGPDWDLYLMSLLFGLIVWMGYRRGHGYGRTVGIPLQDSENSQELFLALYCRNIKDQWAVNTTMAFSGLCYTQVRNAVNFFGRYRQDQLWKTIQSVSSTGRKKGRQGTRQKKKPIEQFYDIGRTSPMKIRFPGLDGRVDQEPVEPIQIDKEKGEKLQDLNSQIREKLEAMKDPPKRRPRERLFPLERGFSGQKMMGQKLGPPPKYGDVDFEGFETYCIQISRTAKMTKCIGRVARMKAFVITGMEKEYSALVKALPLCSRPMMLSTIYHDFFAESRNCRIFAQRCAEGYGIVAHPRLIKMCELVGIKDIYVKVEGSTDKYKSLIFAFATGLLNQETFEELAERKRMHVVELKAGNQYLPKIVASPKTAPVIRGHQLTPDDRRKLDTFYGEGRMPLKQQPRTPFYGNSTRHLFAEWRKHPYRNVEKVMIRLLADGTVNRWTRTERLRHAKIQFRKVMSGEKPMPMGIGLGDVVARPEKPAS
uniref:Ribosomal protein S5 C-terminal domain-containing protein n=1 Tax=Ditylenchus dipsaci TaxID=166011 RepID=A0A915D677_9BILA